MSSLKARCAPHCLCGHSLSAILDPNILLKHQLIAGVKEREERCITQQLDPGIDLTATSIHTVDALLFPEGSLIDTASIQCKDARLKLELRSKAELLPREQLHYIHNIPLHTKTKHFTETQMEKKHAF